MRYKPILSEVLERITPGRQERENVLREVSAFLKKLNSALGKVARAKAVVGGSYAKDTWLKQDHDVDIFAKFALSHKGDDLSGLLEKALEGFSPERVHGSRDYFWVRNNIRFEIVPVLDIKKPEQAENVTDFSPWHVDWVNEHGKGLKGDIRLTKQFCKAARCYGAESYIRGFSGHVVDILTIHYKGFIPLLKAASRWKPKVVVDFNNVYKGRALLMMNKSKLESPLVVVDPVQPERNAAAALSEDNFERFKVAAREFLKNPSVDFFEERSVDCKSLAEKGHLIRVEVKTLDAKEDVAGAKFVSAFNYVRSALSDFGVVDALWEWDRKSRGEWFFVLKKRKLPKSFVRLGPPLGLAGAVERFKRAHKDTFVRGSRIAARVERDLTSAEDVLRSALADEYVRSRVKEVLL
ncbi:hypothetical protein D6825_02680 [Candidatus Woesearchaeota archaeon]|nr:MAG: hypothetical protein D6825_02680 [Candidatus Woesearchaeota archaeon]